MAAIKHTLQREVFLPNGERLIAVVHVTKPGKKKKGNFLCAAVTTEKPIQAGVYLVKKTERGDAFKKKSSFALRELQFLDAKYVDKRDSAEFDIHFDKTYRWIASSMTEKTSFIQCLRNLSHRYLVQKPKFLNLPPSLLEANRGANDVDRSVQQAEDLAKTADWEYQALTEKESDDLENLMSQVENAIGDAEAFADQLSKDLSVLDGANVLSIMGSEDRVMELMVLLDEGLQLAMNIEEKVDRYDAQLQGVKDLMERIRDKDSSIQTRSTNHGRLLETLEHIVAACEIDPSHIRILLDEDLSTPDGVKACTNSAHKLLLCIQAPLEPSLKQLSAVQEQMKKCNKIKTTFSKRLVHHLNSYFIYHANELGGTLSRFHVDMRLPTHAQSHTDLLPYAQLMYWLRQVDSNSFDKLCSVYTQNVSKLYASEIRDFIARIRTELQQSQPARKGEAINWFTTSGLEKRSEGSSKHGRGSQSGGAPGDRFGELLDLLLSQLSEYVGAEEKFCVDFFHIDLVANNDEAAQKRAQEELRRHMQSLMPNLETELTDMVQLGHRLDSYYCLYMLVRLSGHVMSAEDKNSFLTKVFGSVLISVRKVFDAFVKLQVQNIRDCRVSKKTKPGVLSFVHDFAAFAPRAEAIFRGVERRTELDRAYSEIVGAIMQEITRVADENVKLPSDVIKFENYHRMFDVLRQQKITCLETEKRDAKQRYQDCMATYVTASLGRPMEKLNVFFDGIQARVAAGVKEEEVSFQLAFSKGELKKVMREYPSKEVKRGLEQLYRKVEKQLSEEEGLLQVVWHSLQDEFLKQYKYFEGLIAKCYPQSDVTFEFTIDDLLTFFSDIAQSH